MVTLTPPPQRHWFVVLLSTFSLLLAPAVARLPAAGLEYALIVVVSLTVTFGAYDILVRRSGPTRFLFGMRD